MSYTYLQEQGEESSAESFSDIPASVLSRLNLTDANLCYNDSETASCHGSPSGTMLPPSTANRGVERLTQFAADFRAKILVLPDAVKASRESEADSGAKCAASFAKWSPESSSWKTHQFSLLGGSEPFSETWPRWGLMRNGECYPLPMPSGLMELRAWITYASESGSRLPTLTKFDAGCSDLEGKEYNGESRHAMKLIQGLKRLQTPTVADAHGRDRHNQTDGSVILSLLGQCRRLQMPVADDAVNRAHGKVNSRGEPKLSAQVKRMTTPTADDTSHRKKKYAQGGTALSTQAGGMLNPDWTEWFMGWPIGMTALQPLEMDKFHKWLRSHGMS